MTSDRVTAAVTITRVWASGEPGPCAKCGHKIRPGQEMTLTASRDADGDLIAVRTDHVYCPGRRT
jgi:hypothetical protein